MLATVGDRAKYENGQRAAEVLSSTDYFPFGKQIAGRSFGTEDYRFGFNGKENDTDFGDKHPVQDYGFRIYSPEIGKFLSLDPLAPSYPWYTPYQFAGNSPIFCVDVDGLEPYPYYLLPQWLKTTYEGFQGFGEGLHQLAHDLAPIRPADENDPKTLSDSWENIKLIPQNLVKLPSHINDVYTNGTTRDKVRTTVTLTGLIFSMKSGGPKTQIGVVQGSFNISKTLGITASLNNLIDTVRH